MCQKEKKRIKVDDIIIIFLEKDIDYKKDIKVLKDSGILKELKENINKSISKEGGKIAELWKKKKKVQYYYEYFENDPDYTTVVFKAEDKCILVQFSYCGERIKLVKLDFGSSKKSTNESALLEATKSTYKVGDTIKMKFNCKDYSPKISSNYKGEDIDKVLSKINSCISIFNGTVLWNYLAEHFGGNLEGYGYWEDKKVTGPELKKSILSVDYIHIDKYGDIVFVGSSADDEEHGYEVVFPEGKFVKSDKKKYNKETDEPSWKPKITLYTSSYYFQH